LELRMLLYCLMSSAGQDCGDRIRELCEQIREWDEFMRLVELHRVISLVYKGLNRLEYNNIPKPILVELGKRSRLNAQGVLAKAVELVRIVRHFEEKGIPVLPLKGPVIGLLAYGDVAIRHVGDLDIMVSPDRVWEAEGILIRKGFQRTHPHFEMTSRQWSVYFRNNHHFGYVHRDSKLSVELHWRFGSNRYLFPLRFDALWKDRQVLALGGINIPALSLEHTVLLLSTHGANHGWSRLFWLDDLARLVARKDIIDWHRLMRLSDQIGTSRMVAGGVLLANLLLGSPIPGPVRVHAAADKWLRNLMEIFFHLILTPVDPLCRPFTRPYFLNKMHRAMLRNDPRYFLAFCANILGAGYDDWRRRVPLPDAFFPIYYLVRPAMWFFRWYVPGSRTYQEGPMGRNQTTTCVEKKRDEPVFLARSL